MSKLNIEQIAEIEDQVSLSSVQSKELKEDLTDHLCCLIEDDIKKGVPYRDASSRAFALVFPEGLDKSHKKSIMLLTSRKQKRMRSTLFVMCYFAFIIMTCSFMFKALHWPAAGILLIAACSLFTFVFTPLFFMYLYRGALSKIVSKKFQYVLGSMGIVVLLCGIAFKAFHWPGAGILWGIGVLIINLVFLPLIFLGFYRNSKNSGHLGGIEKKFFYLSAYMSSSFFLFASYLKILHWPGSEVLLISSIVVLNFVFLPLLLIKLFRISSSS